jgi:2-iminobutanoate/2-iminopropanoate deaminase
MQRDIQKITGANLPQMELPFSLAIASGDFLFISGQASVNKQGQIVSGSFEEEFHLSMQNLVAILEAAGLSLEDVVQVRAYVANQSDLAQYNQLYRQYFKDPFPARSTLIGCLGDVLKFEIDAMARLRK